MCLNLGLNISIYKLFNLKQVTFSEYQNYHL